MAYIGNTVQNQGFAPAIDYFSGNGSTVTFTLSRPVASVAQIICAIDNVIQNPSTAFTVSGNSITFTSAPLAGTNNIWVEYTSLITTYAAISQSPSVIGDITATGGYLASGSFGNSFIDGTIVDYVTGNGRITTGPADGFTIYNGGTSARNALMTLDSSGNALFGTSSNTSTVGTAIRNGYDAASTVFIGKNNAPANANWMEFAGGGATRAVLAWDTSGGGGYIGSTGAVPFSLYTNNLERLKIDTSGRVTTPYQPFFYARKTASQTIPTDSLISFDTAVTNIGSGYNTSTNRYTAPIAGVYSFSAKVWLNRNGLSYASFDPRINGSRITGSAGAYYDSSINNSGYANYIVNFQYSLNAGDYIDWTLSCPAGNVVLDNSGYFCGFLVG